MLLLSTVITQLKTLLNYMQENKQKQTRANNSYMMDWDCNDLLRENHRKKGRFLNCRVELLNSI